MKIIEFAGKARHGKSSSASIFQYYMENKNKKCIRIGYGDDLKFICEKYFGWNGIKDSAGRSILQKKGEEARANNPDTWVNIVIELIKAYWMDYDYVLIDDFRYPNEFLRLKEEGFNTFTVWIYRNDFDNGLSEEQKNHHSETSLLDYDFDYMISVESKMYKLKDAVEKMIESRSL